jgi:hypothetical protein
MELEVRMNNGILIGKVKGKTAMYQYQNMVASDCFQAERKNLKTDSDKEFIPYLVLTCVIDVKLLFGEFELWLGKGDYVKIT